MKRNWRVLSLYGSQIHRNFQAPGESGGIPVLQALALQHRDCHLQLCCCGERSLSVLCMSCRPSSDIGASMPSILEEDILLPAAPMDISDAQPTQPDRDLPRTVSAARPVPTHSERAPTACIPQESGSYGSSLDSEVLSPPLVSQTLLQSPFPM